MSVASRVREWLRLVSEYAIAQLLVQALGAASGLLIINLLPVREYALYALALSVLSFLAVFSDLGLGSALLYFRREARKCGFSFAPYVVAALRLRRALTVLGATGAIAFLFHVGRSRGFDSTEVLAVGTILVCAVWVQVSLSVRLSLLHMDANYRSTYVAECAGNVVRLAGVLAMAVSSSMLAAVAMLTNLAGTAVSNFLAGRAGKAGQERAGSPAGASVPLPYRDLLRYALPTSASAAYYAVQAPLVVWLSAIYSGTETIAEVGALGRLGLLMGLISGFVSTVLLPRLSVVTDDRLYLRRFLQFSAIIVALSAGVALIAVAYPEAFLMLLGDSYRDLAGGFLLVTIATILGIWGGYVVSVNNARGWVRPQPALVVAYAIAQVAMILYLDLSSTEGILRFGLLSSVAGLVLHAGVSVLGFVRPEWVRIAPDAGRGTGS